MTGNKFYYRGGRYRQVSLYDHAVHVLTTNRIIPYSFVANHHNCAQKRLYCVRTMIWITPDMDAKLLMDGETWHHNARLWNGLPSDQCTESTWMCHGKVPWDVVGNTPANHGNLGVQPKGCPYF